MSLNNQTIEVVRGDLTGMWLSIAHEQTTERGRLLNLSLVAFVAVEAPKTVPAAREFTRKPPHS